MSSEASNEMLNLLKELSVYKAMDNDYGVGVKGRVEARGPRGTRAKATGDNSGDAQARCRQEEQFLINIHGSHSHSTPQRFAD